MSVTSYTGRGILLLLSYFIVSLVLSQSRWVFAYAQRHGVFWQGVAWAAFLGLAIIQEALAQACDGVPLQPRALLLAGLRALVAELAGHLLS